MRHKNSVIIEEHHRQGDGDSLPNVRGHVYKKTFEITECIEPNHFSWFIISHYNSAFHFAIIPYAYLLNQRTIVIYSDILTWPTNPKALSVECASTYLCTLLYNHPHSVNRQIAFLIDKEMFTCNMAGTIILQIFKDIHVQADQFIHTIRTILTHI